MTPLSTGERRALALLAALLLTASAARWIERPRSLLSDAPDVDLAALAAASESLQTTSSRTRSSRSAGTGVDPNRASAEELATLPGIGAGLAARIIAERERAPFATLDDLLRVRGIGPALLARLAGHVTLPPGRAGDRTTAGRDDPPAQPRPRPARTSPGTAPPGTAPAAPESHAPIDLNTASAEQLQAISGVGPAIAKRLVIRRDSLRRFRTYDEVDAVHGVGPALLAKIKAATVIR